MSRKDMYEEMDPEEKRLVILKRLGVTILVILGILVVFMLLRSCGKNGITGEKDLNKTLLEAGKEYYEYNEYALPDSIGECATVDLKTLAELGLIDKSNYTDCENDTTYVKVCKLESGKYHFVALMDCTSEKTDKLYGEWTEGKEKDLVVGESDIKFKYQVQYLDTTNSTVSEVEEYWEDEIPYDTYKTESITKYYRYKDLEYIWNVDTKRYYPGDAASSSNIKEYYKTSPAGGYIYKDSENNKVSKYFSTTEEKEYYMSSNGVPAVSASAPNAEYKYSDNPVYQTRYRTRSWTETSKPVTTEPVKLWFCSKPGDVNQVTSYVPCEENVNNPEYTVMERMIYTCNGGVSEVGQNGTCYRCTDGSGLKTDNTSCGSYGAWSKYTKEVCDVTKTDECTSATITLYQWYKLSNGKRTYYPSGKSNASDENTYYASAPKEGLIEDTATTTTGWKWYSKTNTQTNYYSATAPSAGAKKTTTSRWTSWTSWSTKVPVSLGTSGTRTIESKSKIKIKKIETTGKEEWLDFNKEYMELNELLTALQEKEYKVYSLEDITASGELKYKVKMYIRNKNKESK